MQKILIAVPTFENIYPDVFKAIYDLDKLEGYEVIFEYIRGYDVAAARNRIVEKAFDLKADYILMIDSDVIVPHNVLELFLQDTKDVCLGGYAHRAKDKVYDGKTCICKLEDENGKRYFNYPLEGNYTGKELSNLLIKGQRKIQIHGGGMGCAFFKTSIFEEIDFPWFNWVRYNDEERGTLSEDLYFCEQCKRYGIPVYTDTAVRCKHIFRYAQECI